MAGAKPQKAKVNNNAKKQKKTQKVEHTKPTGQTLTKKLRTANAAAAKVQYAPENAQNILNESIALQARNKRQQALTDPEQIAHEKLKKMAQPTPFNAKQYAASSTATFKQSPLFYRRLPVKDADMILMDELGQAFQNQTELINFVDSGLMRIKDPVLRETIRQGENNALEDERQKAERIRNFLLSALTGNEKIKSLIKEGATNKTVLNAMYNLLPRVMPTRKLRHNIDQMDWLGAVRHRWLHEVEPNGYDVEDSSDPDTLPHVMK